MNCKLKLCKLEELKGNEVIAKPILTPDYNILLSEGTILKLEYINKLRDLDVEEIYIEEDSSNEEVLLLKQDIEVNFKKKVKDILEKHTYNNNRELVEICNTADHLILNILNEDKIVEKIFDLKERNADIYEHCIVVCTMSIILALKLNIPNDLIHSIGVACLLHDIGHRYIVNNTSNIDICEMNEKDAMEYYKHPIYAYSALSNEVWINDVSKKIILHHHERLDGSGYPMKIREIKEEVQIVAVCDTFDEMICGIGSRKYKVYEAIEYLKTFKNIHFSGKIIDALLELVAMYPVGSLVKTNLNEEAIVYKQNKGFPERPYLKIIKDARGKKLAEKKIINLVEELTVFINQVLN